MKSFKNKNIDKNTFYSSELRLGVFAEPSARKSYQRLFEIAKLNFQSINSPHKIANMLHQA